MKQVSPPELCQIAAEAALEGDDEMDAVREGYRKNRALLADRLPAMALPFAAPMDGAFYAWVDVSGHTNGHVAYHIAKADVAFVGDSVFALGCGRMFEGQPEQFWHSLDRIRQLPDNTLLYCAHEYTASNARFAVHADPDNTELLTDLPNGVEHDLPSLRSVVPDEIHDQGDLDVRDLVQANPDGLGDALGVQASGAEVPG